MLWVCAWHQPCRASGQARVSRGLACLRSFSLSQVRDGHAQEAGYIGKRTSEGPRPVGAQKRGVAGSTVALCWCLGVKWCWLRWFLSFLHILFSIRGAAESFNPQLNP
eukprot:1307683-Prymnesium_polylepis.1